MSQSQVLAGVERRRRWSEDQKREIMAAAFAPGAMVSAVAQRIDIHSSIIYRWRRKLRAAQPEFSRVIVAQDSAGSDIHADAIEVAIGTTRIRIPALTRPDLAAAVVHALVRR
jgi:transposase